MAVISGAGCWVPYLSTSLQFRQFPFLQADYGGVSNFGIPACVHVLGLHPALITLGRVFMFQAIECESNAEKLRANSLLASLLVMLPAFIYGLYVYWR